MSANFRFKRFEVVQQRSAMKVGTDGVLLGAWAQLTTHHKRVLDVGTGTGVVALMMAQRSQEWTAEIVAVEIDEASATEAADNFAASPWSDRLSVAKCALQNYKSETLFDHIVSNPPYFVSSLHSPDAGRTLARHTDSLSFDDLARAASRLLSNEGVLSVVLPADALGDITLAAARTGLFLCRRCDVYSKSSSLKPIRVLLEFGRAAKATDLTRLTIHEGGDYADEYKDLTKDFYLAF